MRVHETTNYNKTMKSRYLIAYFQPIGNQSNSAKVAEAIEDHLEQKEHQARMFAITPVEAYPADENEFMAATKAEAEHRSRPEIVGKVSDGYYANIKDIILVAPNWWNSLPKAVFSFFDQHDNHYKRSIPVILHGGDGAGKIVEDMRRFLPDADVMDPVEISEDELSGDLKAKIDQVSKEIAAK